MANNAGNPDGQIVELIYAEIVNNLADHLVTKESVAVTSSAPREVGPCHEPTG